jgi:hypothetical protein
VPITIEPPEDAILEVTDAMLAPDAIGDGH